MSYRLLLLGSNENLIKEFLSGKTETLECLTSSHHIPDVEGHLKYFEPDAVVLCLFKVKQFDIVNLDEISAILRNKDLPLITIGNAFSCGEFERASRVLVNLAIQESDNMQKVFNQIFFYIRQQKVTQQQRQKQQEIRFGISEQPVDLEVHPDQENKKRILVVDDDAVIRTLLQKLLGKKYDVTTVASGREALSFLEVVKTDLVLLDYEMPEENGAQVLLQIRERQGSMDLPVIFLTGVSEKEKILEVLSLKPQGYLLKPIQPADLLREIGSTFNEE